MNQGNKLPYLDFLGLNRNPFPVTPDADDFFVSTNIDIIVTELVHGITLRKGFFVLTGEVGVGKTTISRKILQILTEGNICTSLVFHSLLSESGFIRQINKDFGIEGEAGDSDEELAKLNNFVLQQNAEGRNCAIIIDDAQNLSWESLEIIRMISNLEGNSEKLVQILLVGQPELIDRLNNNDLRQLKSRIVIQHEVSTLSRQGLQKYIDFKLTTTGPTRLATPNSVFRIIYAETQGNLRRVNILMDRCLYVAYSNQSQSITPKMVRKAADDLKTASPRLFRRQWSLLAVFIFVVLGGVFVALGDFSFPDLNKGEPASVVIPIVRSEEIKSPPPIVPESILTFLGEYNLGDYGQQFWKAIQHDNLLPLKQKIYQARGLQMVIFSEIPTALKHLDALRIAGKKSENPHYIFFWKPQLNIEQFHFRHQGKSIVQLQYLLEGQYYTGPIDGIVGRKLMQAIVDFQTDLSLPVTGIPDNSTLFVLCSLKNKSERI